MVVVVSNDGWVALGRRSEHCDGNSRGKIVAAVGESSTPDDVTGGFWNPELTARRGLLEEAALNPGDYHLEYLATAVTAGDGVHAAFRADTYFERNQLAELMAAAEDAWERSEILWWPLEALDALLDAPFDWGTWGASSTALLCAHAGIDTSGRRVERH